MSTYGGKFSDERFKNVCIDNFLPKNYDCTHFFLSHFHADHMRGIKDPSFHSLFEKRSTWFYCHEITRQFILKSSDIRIPEYKIKSLDRDGNAVELEEDVWIRVTYIPAGHCPGSIMLLFNGFGERILYTGDIRLSVDDLSKMDVLHSEGELLPIGALYLDTTFASKEYMRFPSRIDSLGSIKTHIDEWLAKDSLNRVCILPTACIGIEFLMVELCKIYNQKIHVSNDAYSRFLQCIPHLNFAVSTSVENALIHFCQVSQCDVCFRSIYKYDNLLLIKPSALYFTQDKLKQHGAVFKDNSILRVCYSSHSSCEELIDIVRYLKPKRVFQCVVPPFTPTDKPNQFFSDFLAMVSRKELTEDDVAGSNTNKGALEAEEAELDALIGLSDAQVFVRVMSKYLFRPVQLQDKDDSASIERLGLQTPT